MTSSSRMLAVLEYLVFLRRLILASSWLLISNKVAFVFSILSFHSAENDTATSQTRGSSSPSSTSISNLSTASTSKLGTKLCRHLTTLWPTPVLPKQCTRACALSSHSASHPWTWHPAPALCYIVFILCSNHRIIKLFTTVPNVRQWVLHFTKVWTVFIISEWFTVSWSEVQ